MSKIPRLLTPDQERISIIMSRANLAIFEANPDGFCKRFVTQLQVCLLTPLNICCKMSSGYTTSKQMTTITKMTKILQISLNLSSIYLYCM